MARAKNIISKFYESNKEALAKAIASIEKQFGKKAADNIAKEVETGVYQDKSNLLKGFLKDTTGVDSSLRLSRQIKDDAELEKLDSAWRKLYPQYADYLANTLGVFYRNNKRRQSK